MSENSKRAPVASHILSASANLLGICFLIFSLVIHQSGWNATILDECAAISVVFFFVASLCSYISLRKGRSDWWETIADVTFFSGLIVMAIASILISFQFLA